MAKRNEHLTPENGIIAVCALLIVACLALGMWLPNEDESTRQANDIVSLETCTAYKRIHPIPYEGQLENATGIYRRNGIALCRKDITIAIN